MQKARSEWEVCLSEADVAEVEAALAAAMATGKAINDLTQHDFPLPTLGPRLVEIHEEVVHGRGFQLIKGLPVQRYSPQEVMTIYWCLGTWFGKAQPQNKKAHLIGHVRDVHSGDGLKDPVNRIYSTNGAEPWHVDDADVVGLLCLRTASQGGKSCWASSATIHNRMLDDNPELLRLLYEPSYLDRKNEVPEGKLPWFVLPVFNEHQGHVCCFYAATYVKLCQRHAQVPRLTDEQEAAFAEFERLANSDECCMHYKLEVGDIQLLNNHTVVHNRSAFTDFEEEDRKRHLLRMWLAPQDGWELPEQFAERYHTVTKGDRGGIYCPGAKPYIPLTPFG